VAAVKAIVVAGILVALGARGAHAGEHAAVIVAGKAPIKDRTVVAAAARSAAHEVGWELVDAPIPERDVDALVACLKTKDVRACADPIASRLAIPRLIIVRPEVDTGGTTITEQILMGAAPTTSDDRYCEKCNEEKLQHTTYDLTKSLIREAVTGAARTRLAVRSTPTGAWITIDSKQVGLTNRVYSTFAGHHVILFQHPGYMPETRAIDAVEDQETPVDVTLRPIGEGHVVENPTPPSYVLPGVVAGVGAVVLVIGIGLQATVSSPPTGTDQPSTLYSKPGIGLMLGGAAIAAFGGYLLYTTHRDRSSSQVTVSADHSGAVVGWAHRF
jgi:hypothetical protein